MFDRTFFSLISHIFVNPVLYFLMVNGLIRVREENPELRDLDRTRLHRLSFGLMLATYLFCSCAMYIAFMFCVYVVLRFLGLTPNLSSFLYTQYCYDSPLRLIVVGLLVLHTALWSLKQRIWKYQWIYFGPALIAAAIIQVFLFFKNLY